MVPLARPHHRPGDLAIVRPQLAVTCLHLGRWADAKRYAELATDVPGTDLDPALALSVALEHLGDSVAADRERRGFNGGIGQPPRAARLEVGFRCSATKCQVRLDIRAVPSDLERVRTYRNVERRGTYRWYDDDPLPGPCACGGETKL